MSGLKSARKGAARIGAVVAIATMLLVAGAPAQARAHSYFVVGIKTGTVNYAGTDAQVRALLVGATGTCETQVLDTPNHNDFERGSYDTFNVTCDYIGAVRQVWLKQYGNGPNPGWYVDYVRVDWAGGDYAEYYYRWIDPAYAWV
jgi:hypothetical protein